jgi:uncharacterized membrane protein
MERNVGLALGIATLASVALLAAGIAGMALTGTAALERPFPEFEPGRLPADLAALEPDGFLWLGLVAVILTPLVRVFASLLGFAVAGERRMAVVALTVAVVISLSAFVGAQG